MNNVSNLSKNKYTIPPKSNFTINFMGARPNYYRITNNGGGNLYIGISMIPTNKFFDMVVPATATKLYVDAFGSENLYIYNPNSEEINIIVTSFKAEFDPVALAMTDLSQDFSDIQLNTNTAITGFEVPLPAGDNIIGNVKIDSNSATDLANRIAIYIGKHDLLKNIGTNSDNIHTKVGSILEIMQSADNTIDYSTVLDELKTTISILSNQIVNIVGNQEATNEYLRQIAENTNTGDGDITLMGKPESKVLNFPEWEEDTGIVYGNNCMVIEAPDGYYFSYVSNHTGQDRCVLILADFDSVYEEHPTYTRLTVEEYNASGIKATKLVVENNNNASGVSTIITTI